MHRLKKGLSKNWWMTSVSTPAHITTLLNSWAAGCLSDDKTNKGSASESLSHRRLAWKAVSRALATAEKAMSNLHYVHCVQGDRKWDI